MKPFLCLFAFALALPRCAFACEAPPLKIPDGLGAGKSRVVVLAKYSPFMTAQQRSYRQGGVYDTRKFCSAVIDIVRDPGVMARVEILGFDDVRDQYQTVHEVPTIRLKGDEKADSDGIVRRTIVVALHHNETAFLVSMEKASIATKKTLYVDMTALPCGSSFPS